MKRNSRVAGPLLAAAVTLSAATGFAGTAEAQRATPPSIWAPLHKGGPGNGHMHRGRTGHRHAPGVLGNITSVNGTIVTVIGINGTSYTVDVSAAKIVKSVAGAVPAPATLSDLIIGDTVGIKGTLTGTNMIATEIFDGVPPRPLLPFMMKLQR